MLFKKYNLSNLDLIKKRNYLFKNLIIFKKKIENQKEEKIQIRAKTGTLFSKNKGKKNNLIKKNFNLTIEKEEKIAIDDFNILKVLGRGAFGKVMLVEKIDSKEIFALKSLRKVEIIEKDQIEHTKTEKAILEHINFPFLLNLIYAFQTPEKIYFATKFMRGGELFQHLRISKRFSEERLKYFK